MKPPMLKDVSKARPPMTDIATLRQRARQHIEEGAVTSNYEADRETVIKLLNEALATELVCVLRYKRHYFMASGVHSMTFNRRTGSWNSIICQGRPVRRSLAAPSMTPTSAVMLCGSFVPLPHPVLST